jgi:hypothetical protein
VADAPTELADRLYAVPPRRFVAERDAAVAAARAGGDAAAAAALSRLRRPTVAAWLVNLLALRRPDLVTELTDLAVALRVAQQRLHGADLRELATRRRAVVARMVAAARSLAVETEPELDGAKLPLAEVETTLAAALADPAVAARVRAGRLLRPVTHAGFGEPAGASLRLVPGGAGGGAAGPAAQAPPADQPAAQAREAQAREVQAREAERRAAEAALADAEAALAGVAGAKREAKRALTEIETALAGLEARLTEQRAARVGATRRLAQVEAAELAARRAVVTARRRVATAGAP